MVKSKMKITKNWWKNFFNNVYLITDSRSVCNNKLTRKEVTLIEKILRPGENDKILDLCGGQGRHALELARRGYENITVLDYSHYLTRLGRESAKKDKLKIRFLKRDARSTGLKGNDYSSVFVMANSFGYFPDEKENLKILKESYRLLKKGGTLLLDLADPTHVRNNLKPFSWHEANKDIIVCRRRELQGNVIKVREIVLSKKDGLLRDGFYCERIYNKNSIKRSFLKAGFRNISVKSNLSLHGTTKDYGLLTSRMFVTGKKP